MEGDRHERERDAMRGVDMTWLFTLDDGRTRRWDMYLSLDAALEAARSGLRSAS